MTFFPLSAPAAGRSPAIPAQQPGIEPVTRLLAWHAASDRAQIGRAGDAATGGNVPVPAPAPAGDPFDFSALDGNGDGTLSGLEVAGVDPGMRQALDTDRNGELSQAEFVRGTLRTRVLQRDANGDGYLSGTEITADMAPYAYQAADGRRILTPAHLYTVLAQGPGVTPGPAPAPAPAPAPVPGVVPAPAPPTPTNGPPPAPVTPPPAPVQPVAPPAPPAPQPQPWSPPPTPEPGPKKKCCPGH